MPDTFHIIGRIGAPHGVKGWVKVISFTEKTADIFSYLPWYLQVKGSWQKQQVTAHQAQGKHFIAQLEGCHDRDQAQTYTNHDIGVSREQFPTLGDGQYYWADLEGMSVKTIEGIELGKVDHLFHTGSNDVMVVEGKKRYLIPFLQPEFVTAVDQLTKSITVDWDPEF